MAKTLKKESPYYHPNGMPGDKRHKDWKAQRKARGFDDRELWSLDSVTAAWLLPRLERFKVIDICAREDDFNKGLDEAIWAFGYLSGEDRWVCYDKKVWKRVEKALGWFAANFTRLWT